jgi:hypothetical protein
MKYYETSALNANNIENMFFAMIDEINSLQQTRRKRALNEDDADLNPPLTTDNIKSDGLATGNEAQSDRLG